MQKNNKRSNIFPPSPFVNMAVILMVFCCFLNACHQSTSCKKEDGDNTASAANHELFLSSHDAYIAIRKLSKTVSHESVRMEIERVPIEEINNTPPDGIIHFGLIGCNLKDKTFHIETPPPLFFEMKGIFCVNEKGEWEARGTYQRQGHPLPDFMQLPVPQNAETNTQPDEK
ncbi:MAG: hypothetical protein FWC50_14535 [Planctomycetaceae bacterium]|nr:hypothetical protein [Planctomycetaceae bacterium]